MTQVLGEFAGMSQSSAQLQAISDQQAQIMRQLGQTLDGLAPTFQGQAAVAMQNLGDRLIMLGNQFSAKFASHSDMMGQNVQLLDNTEQQSTSAINAVHNLTG